MPKHTMKAEKRAAKQFAAELYTAAASALDAVAAAKGGDSAALDSAHEALAFLVEQAQSVLDHLDYGDENAADYIAHVEALAEGIAWISPVAKPLVYRDEKAEGYFVEALIWVGDEEMEELDEDEDEDEDDDLDEDEDEDDEE